jgi:O-antigen/teichoic acid export membrane protein
VTSAGASADPFARSRRTARNALFGFSGFVYSAVLAVVITPVLVHGLGPVYYGIFALSAVAVSFVGMLDFGMGTALVQFLSSSLARSGAEEPRQLVQASAAFYAIVGVVGFAITIVVGTVLAPAVFDLAPRELAVARFALIVSGAAFAFDTVARAYSAVPLALQRTGVSAAVRILWGTVGAAVTLAVVLPGLGLRWLVAGYAAIDIAGLVLAAVVARRVLPGLRIRPRWDSTRIRRLMTFSGWVFLANMSAFVIFQFDRIMLGALASVSAVTYYAVPSSMASYLLAATSSLAAIVVPATGDLIARGDAVAVERLYRRATRLCLLFVGSLAVPAMFFGHSLLEVWLGRNFAGRSTTVFQVLAGTFVLFSLTVVPYNMLIAGGRPKIVGILNLSVALLNVGLIFVLIPPYGATGAAVAYLLSILLFPLFIWYAETRVLGYTRPRWLSIVWRVLPPLALQAAACALMRPFLHGAWAIPAALAVLPVPGLVYLWTGLIDPDERAIIREVVRR